VSDLTKDLLRRAYQVAWELSDDKQTKNGAILVNPFLPNPQTDLVGANRLPEFVERIDSRLERPAKYEYLIHAEQDVLMRAARLGVETLGLHMICPWAACTACAQSIIQAGIATVIVHGPLMRKTPDRWEEKINIARDMFQEANVAFDVVDGEIGGVQALFDGEVWHP
jgi:dCMP deaminase